MARIALAVAGGIVGSLFGQPQIGFLLGGVLGGILFPGKLPPGPRLTDLTVTSSTNGMPIQFGYGTQRVAGNVIWAAKIVEHAKKKSVKGGPSQTTFSYTASFAVAFGEGPAALKRVWFDSKIVYDPALPGAQTPKYPKPVFYSGNETQAADPTIQADKLAANTPAFRGITYAVWTDFPLADFGNRVPNIRAEITYLTAIGSPVNGVGSFDQVAVNSGNGTAITTPSLTPAASGEWALQVLLGNSTITFAAPWTVFQVSVDAADSQQVLPSTAPIAGAATDSVSEPWCAALLLFGLFGTSPPTIVQTSNVSGAFGPPVQVIFGSNNTLGNTIIVISKIKGLSGGDSGMQVSDTQGNAYTRRVHVINGLLELDVFVAQNVKAGANTITFTGTGVHTSWVARCIELQAGALGTVPKLDGVVQDICTRSGLAVTDVDVTPLVGTTGLLGYTVTRPGDATTALKPLAMAFFFDAVESGGVVRFVPRAGTVALNVPEMDLGLRKDNAELTEEVYQQQDMPRNFEVVYNDPLLDYQTNKQHKRRSSRVVAVKNDVVVELPLTMSASTARQISEKMLYLTYLERKPFNFNLWKSTYILVDPTDLISFVFRGLTFIARVVKSTLGTGYTIAIASVNENVSTYLSSAPGSVGTGVVPGTVPVMAQTTLFLLDIPLLQDADSNPGATGYYFMMSSPTPATWPGAALMKSSDNANFGQESSDSIAANYGVAQTILGAPVSPWTWDTVNTLDVNFTVGVPASTTDLNVLNGANALLVGSEVIQFVNATLVSGTTYRLSRLLRGRRGTDPFTGTHGAAETVIDLIGGGVVRVPDPLAILGMLRYYRGVTVGQDITTVTSQLFTIAGVDLKPYAPTAITGTRDGGQNLTIGWIRRTRIGGDWLNSTGFTPLGEDSEQYSIDIMQGATVKRTITWTPGTYDVNGNPTAVYTAAQQVTDFGSTQAAVLVNIYQVSGEVGRGFAGIRTV